MEGTSDFIGVDITRNVDLVNKSVTCWRNVPCVICGYGLVTVENEGTTIDILVKEEVPCTEDDDASQVVDDSGTDHVSFNDSESANHEEATTGLSSSSLSQWTDEEKWIYQWFLKCFKLQLRKKVKVAGKQKKFVNCGWDGESGTDRFPFCGSCKGQSLELMELQRKLEELEMKIKCGVEALRTKASCFEEGFERTGIYEKDERFRRARRQFVTDYNSRNVAHTNDITSKSGKLRRSTRRLEETQSDPLRNPAVTIVLVGKSITEERALEAVIKSEIAAIDPVLQESVLNLGNAENKINHGKKESRRGRRFIFSKKQKSPDSHDSSQIQQLEEDQSKRSELLDKDNHDSFSIDNEDDDCHNKSPTSPHPSLKLKRKKRIVVKADEDEDHDPELSSQSTKRRKRPAQNEDNDSDYAPEELPSTKRERGRRSKEISTKTENYKKFRSTPSPPPFGGRNRMDEDWNLDGDEDEEQLRGSEDSAEEEYNDNETDYNPETGKRKHSKIILDPRNKTLTYKGLVFNLIEPPSSNMFQCSECNSEVKNEGMKIRHHFLRNHSNLYACKICDYRANCRSKLKEHVGVVHEGKPSRRQKLLNCRICGKPTGRLKIHEWSHKNKAEREEAIAAGADDVPLFQVNRNHQCDECGKGFNSASSLGRHKEEAHLTEEAKEKKKELCPHCGGTYLDLKGHMRFKHEKKSLKMFTCLEPGCGRTFPSLSRLTCHKNAVHRKIRQYKCTLCPREFSNQLSFQNHVNGHSGIRPWQCEHCPMAFTTKSSLQRHTALYHTPGVAPPKRKPYVRGPTMLGSDVKKRDLINEGKYLPPSALASWAAGREPTSHFPPEMNPS